MSRFRYSDEMLSFLEAGFKKMPIAELTTGFNNKYRCDKNKTAIHALLTRKGFSCGRSGHFEKGQKPWNTGVKGYMGANKTSFKKGHTPPNRRELGAERICSKDGYVLVKVAEKSPSTGFSTRFKAKHIVVWEQHNGSLPGCHCIRFRDGNVRNCNIENLFCVSRAEHLHLTRMDYKNVHPEVKPTVEILAKMEVKTFERSRQAT